MYSKCRNVISQQFQWTPVLRHQKKTAETRQQSLHAQGASTVQSRQFFEIMLP
jgi:hypothetical protein